MVRLGIILVSLALLTHAGAAEAQVIFEPVRVQYGGGSGGGSDARSAPSFFYGGQDPSVFRLAVRSAEAEAANRGRGGFLRSTEGAYFRPVSTDRPRIYVDTLRVDEASTYGYTVDDALNAANRSLPRYFRKSDLLAGRRTGEVLIVPPDAPVERAGSAGRFGSIRPVGRCVASASELPAEPSETSGDLRTAAASGGTKGRSGADEPIVSADRRGASDATDKTDKADKADAPDKTDLTDAAAQKGRPLSPGSIEIKPYTPKGRPAGTQPAFESE